MIPYTQLTLFDFLSIAVVLSSISEAGVTTTANMSLPLINICCSPSTLNGKGCVTDGSSTLSGIREQSQVTKAR